MQYKYVIKNLCIVLCCIFFYYIFFGSYFLQEYFKCVACCNYEKEKIAELSTDIQKIEQINYAWKNDPITIERYARLDLCLGYTNELIYLIKKKPL